MKGFSHLIFADHQVDIVSLSHCFFLRIKISPYVPQKYGMLLITCKLTCLLTSSYVHTTSISRQDKISQNYKDA